MIGRFLGLVFVIPFAYFLIKKKLSKKLIRQSIILFVLGGLQGGIGWWMVKSGLENNPDVSHYRLAVHLITAFLTCAFTFWVALPLIFTDKNTGNFKLFRLNFSLLILVIIQIVYGAFVAGLDAGKGFNSWPKMGEKWIADAVYQLEPFWRNLIESPYGIQFIHRTLALIIVAFVLYIWLYSKKENISSLQQKSLNILLGVVIIQTLLGIFTLILFVPISLALTHQIVAFFLLMSVVFSLFVFKKS
jgi:cytochrome c oxidase assembly protein subunit 15